MVELPDVRPWPGLSIDGPLAGGARAAVFAAHRGADRFVVKVSPRGPESLDWELALLDVLGRSGVRVPAVLSTGDGQGRAGPVFVQSFLSGRPPRTSSDWALVGAVMARVHEVTRGWPQRPGALGVRPLLTADRGADVDLTAMSGADASLIRERWQQLVDLVDADSAVGGSAADCVVHGDLGAGAVLIDGDGVGLIDWDEARVDLPAFDVAGPPDESNQRAAGAHRTIRLAALAWEVATCWVPEPAYARRLLMDLREATRSA